MTTIDLSVFDGIEEYPSPDAKRRLEELVGIEDQRSRLEKGLRIILDPDSLVAWSKKSGSNVESLVRMLQQRPPLFMLAGDVGTGKTALAENIGDLVARGSSIHVTLYRMSLASRGTGLVGQMTALISGAFARFMEAAKKTKSTAKHRGAHLLLVDEADALAQTRESSQMHHEDRAGVDALIRGIDELSHERLPAAVIMCTNRLGAIDPAIRRRAAEILEFHRPANEQRRQILAAALTPAGFDTDQIERLVATTGGNAGRPGFTYSDLTQRLLPSLVLDAYPDKPITFERSLSLATTMQPTPKFSEQS